MNQADDNRVRPLIRVVAGVLGAAAVTATALAMVKFVPAIFTPTAAITRRYATSMIGGSLVLMFSVGWLLVRAAWTGNNPDISDDADDEIDPPAP